MKTRTPPKALPPADHSALRAEMAYSPMVADILRDIREGRLTTGDRLASEVQLRERYGISITSIKRGMAHLVRQGILRRRRGSGTYVTDRSEGPRRVARDTVALVHAWKYWRYHPYFTELLKGIHAGLARAGWHIHEIGGNTPVKPPPDKDISHRYMTPGMLQAELEQHPEIAGVVAMDSMSGSLSDAMVARLPVVETGHTERCSRVAYDWPAEFERCLRYVHERGSRRPCIVGSFPEALWAPLCRRVTGAVGRSPIEPHYVTTANSPAQSEIVRSAYERALAFFGGGKRPADGLVIASDLDAQGVMDALLRVPETQWRGLPVIMLVNRASVISTHMPVARLVADGHAHGVAIADLLDRLISSPHRLRQHLTLSCTLEVDLP